MAANSFNASEIQSTPQKILAYMVYHPQRRHSNTKQSWGVTGAGKIPKFPGSAYLGKHRYVPAATKSDRYLLWQQWRNEEEVMKYISKPYVTADEELEYLESVGLKHQDVDPLFTSHIETPMKQRYAIDILENFDRSRQHEILD